MIALVKKILNIDLIKVSGLTGISTVIRLLTSLGLSKYLAIMIGPSGLAIIGQLTNVTQTMITFCTLASTQAVTKYASEYKDEEHKYYEFLTGVLKMLSFSSILVSVFSFFASDWLSIKVIGTTEYSTIFKIFAFNLCLFTLNGFLLAIINGKKQFKKFVKINIITSIISALLTMGLIWYYGVFGGLVSYVTAQSIILLFTFYAVKDEALRVFSELKNYQLKPKLVKQVLAFSLMTLVSMLMYPTSKLMIRTEIIQNLDLMAAGIWEGMNKISTMFLMLFTTTIPIYYLPRLSELKTPKALKKEVYLTFKIIVPTIAFLAIVIYLLRYYVIIIALSDTFLPMMDLFAIQLTGDIFRVVSLIFGFTLVAKAKITQFIIIEILAILVYVGGTFLLVKDFGLKGAVLSYLMSYMFYAVASFVMFQRNLKLNDAA
jgi:PST family polysaccharide transporter